MGLCCAWKGTLKSRDGSDRLLSCPKTSEPELRAMPAVSAVIAPDFRKLRRVKDILLTAPKRYGVGCGDTLLLRLKTVYVTPASADNWFGGGRGKISFLQNLVHSV